MANYETLRNPKMDVLKAHEFQNGDISFDCEINGIRIYGAAIRNGKNGEFISFPQRQGKDGKYYSIVWCALDDRDQRDLIGAVHSLLGNDRRRR